MCFTLLNRVLLACSFVVLFSACTKKNNLNTTVKPPVKSTLTSKMGGVRNWHGSHYYTASGIHFPTSVHESYNYHDTSFALTIVGDSSIRFRDSTFKYDQTDATNGIYFFGTAYYYYEYGMGTGVAYYFAKDSIVYCNGDRHGTSDSWELKDLYYTY